MFLRHDGSTEIYPSEGGHRAFAPLDEEQDRLLDSLRAKRGRVSYEHLLSGRGLTDLYRFCCRQRESVDSIGTGDDRGGEVITAARSGEATAVAALELFWSVLGAFAGDAVLTYLGTGGVYLAGGILPRIPPAIGREHFCRAFEEKGSMSAIVANVPVHLVTSDDVGLIGAQARITERLAGQKRTAMPGTIDSLAGTSLSINKATRPKPFA